MNCPRFIGNLLFGQVLITWHPPGALRLKELRLILSLRNCHKSDSVCVAWCASSIADASVAEQEQISVPTICRCPSPPCYAEGEDSRDTLNKNVLQFIHARRVIHRDIKPENIIHRSSDRLQNSSIQLLTRKIRSQPAHCWVMTDRHVL